MRSKKAVVTAKSRMNDISQRTPVPARARAAVKSEAALTSFTKCSLAVIIGEALRQPPASPVLRRGFYCSGGLMTAGDVASCCIVGVIDRRYSAGKIVQ